MTDENRRLSGRIALVAGATRGASKTIATELARQGAFVYATGRSSREHGRSEIDRPETIEDTQDAIAAVGEGVGLRVDHLEPVQVARLMRRIENDHGRLDILVNGIFGGDAYAQFGKKLWEHDLPGGIRMLRMGIETHAITSHYALPVLIKRPGGVVIELTDGTEDDNRVYRAGVGFFYDLVKAAVGRMTVAQAHELADHHACAIGVTPGWLRSENMLDIFGVSEGNWIDGTKVDPHFAISETPEFVARGIAALILDDKRDQFSGQVLSSADLARHYGVTDVDGSQPDASRYIKDVVLPGKPADVTGYR